MNTDAFNEFFGSEPPTGPPNPRPPAEPEEAPAQLGPYQVTRRLGKGAFGIVYECWDKALERKVAVKVPQRRFKVGDEDGYQVEAKILANLDHLNIVPVHHIDRMDDGRLLIVYKFIEGSDLKARLESSRLKLTESCRLVATIADALHYAHLQGLVHRDIKPANILLDKTGRVYLADFGLALREEDFGKGSTGAGTIPYMSPEQARSEGHRVDGRSDIFSLGTVFYEMLTGRRPFAAESISDLLDQIIGADPRPPRQINDDIPREVERICLKALAKQASQRYTTAKDMAEDLQAFLETQKAVTYPTPKSVVVPPESVPPTPPSSSNVDVVVVPKGLRSFESGDADFFLELLPGPRDRECVPDSIRTWRQRIVNTDEPFRVGLIYGPSGCGKSSLVKAGLIPRLPRNVISIYVEAAAELTEERILTRLRKQCPALPEKPLDETLILIRRGVHIDPGAKLLIVIDQFEQWLHTRKEGESSELERALRQCDGARVQSILLVRDDFWMAVTRLMRDLDLKIADDSNAAGVDLFDMRHAKKVLTLLGRAHNALPAGHGDLSADQQRFIDQAVEGLSQNGKLIPVRLALFSEMVKGRPWTPATLKAIGGIEGVGATFLEESLSANTAPAQNRLHEQAARAVLKALLPEPGKDIKGNMRSFRELKEISGYGGRPNDFDDLMRILHRELRLVSPADLEGVSTESSSRIISKDEHYYQLTHDYLVPSLRDWLTRKQRETRRGRAELMLAERAALFESQPEKRNTLSLFEWTNVRWQTRNIEKSQSESSALKQSDRHHGFRIAVAIAAVVAFGYFMKEYLGRIEAYHLATELKSANINQVPRVLDRMGPHRRWLEPNLRGQLISAVETKDRVHELQLRLALLRWDDTQAEMVCEHLVKAEPTDLQTIINELAPHSQKLKHRLVQKMRSNDEDPTTKIRAAAGLARMATDDVLWADWSEPVARLLVSQHPLTLDYWRTAFRPLRSQLLKPLADILNCDNLEDAERRNIIGIFEDFTSDIADGHKQLEQHLARWDNANASLLPAIAAKRQADVGAALVAIKHGDKVWPRLSHSPDPTLRSQLIERLAPSGVTLGQLNAQLDSKTEVSIRRAIILAIGQIDVSRIGKKPKDVVVESLLKIFRDDPDPGIHSAAEWLLCKWGHAEQCQRILASMRNGKIIGDRRWFVSKSGQTFAVLRFVPIDSGADSYWLAVATREVTVKEMLSILPDNPFDRSKAPTEDCPVNKVSWFNAADYCTKLSIKEGIPTDELIFVPNVKGMFLAGMSYHNDFLKCSGYRFPTGAEFSFLCRAGAGTDWPMGQPDDELIGQYGWFKHNSLQNGSNISWPCGLKKPNDFGLFDILGNVGEGCMDLDPNATNGITPIPIISHEGRTFVSDDSGFCTYGGSYYDWGSTARYNRKAVGSNRIPGASVGFRLVRVIPGSK